MPVTFISVSHLEATKIIDAILNRAGTDSGSPVAAAVVDCTGRLIAFAAMDNVMPASIKLAQAKAYSAVLGKRDTVYWASTKKNNDQIDFDMRNWTDANFTGFTGGIVISFNNQIIGGIGVSGRKGKQDSNDVLMQDNELALYGRSVLEL